MKISIQDVPRRRFGVAVCFPLEGRGESAKQAILNYCLRFKLECTVSRYDGLVNLQFWRGTMPAAQKSMDFILLVMKSRRSIKSWTLTFTRETG